MTSFFSITSITIDHGNSNPHVGLMRGGLPERIVPLKTFEEERLWESPPYHDAPILLSKVGPHHPFFDTEVFKSRLIDLRPFKKEKMFLEMPFNYSSSLGDDRLYQAHYAFHHINMQKNILLIDSGTFLTVDLISRLGFQGGYIFPGEGPFFQSFGKGSNLPVSLKLPLTVAPISSGTGELPHSTEEAIRGAATVYLQALYREVLFLHPEADGIVFTGGRAEKHLPFLNHANLRNCPVTLDKEFIHRALAGIHSYLHLKGLLKGKLK